jgi:hypothetical protein
MLEDDYMCFLAIDDAASALQPLLHSSLEFEMHYPPALKIHPSVYNMLETLQEIDVKASGDTEKAHALRLEAFKDTDLSFSYQKEFFGSDSAEELPSSASGEDFPYYSYDDLPDGKVYHLMYHLSLSHSLTSYIAFVTVSFAHLCILTLH